MRWKKQKPKNDNKQSIEEVKAENALLNDTLLEMVSQLHEADERNELLNDTVLTLVEQMGA